ncbi:MAG: hypothetical protein AAF965_09605, partial [Pseudomonadota bacterium]
MIGLRPPGFTRRTLLALLGLGLPAASVSAPSLAGDWNAEAALCAHLEALRLPFAPARLELVSLLQNQSGESSHMRAVVRLTWRPGFRQLCFTASDPDPR